MTTGEAQARTLFSRHYSETRLPGHPEWAEDPRPTFDTVRALRQLTELQWREVVRHRLGDLDKMSKLAAVFEQYRAVLAPLMRRIERTDGLINQVVHQLYGLTEEEIAVVEGRAVG